MKVVEIFTSIEGEGKRAGRPCTFVRFFGCNCACTYCDTPYGHESIYEKDTQEMSVDEVLEEVKKRNIPAVTLTGGEPLLQEEFDDLAIKLIDAGFWVNVETNGSIYPTIREPGIFYTMDFKTKSSGMSALMNTAAIESLDVNDVLKFVVGTEEDLEQTLSVLKLLKRAVQVYYSPVFGKIEPARIVDFLMEHELYYCHVQLQLHKYIYPPEMRGV